MKARQVLVAAFFLIATALPATATAELLQAYVNGHGSFVSGDGNKLSYFGADKENGGFGYGFTVGGEVAYIDLFLDANFQPTGSQWNQLGLGFDMDLIPGGLFVEPTAQVIYFFGKQADGSDGVKGFFPRAGVQAGLEFAKILYFGAEAYGGYVLSSPDPEAGFAYMAGLYFGARIGFL